MRSSIRWAVGFAAWAAPLAAGCSSSGDRPPAPAASVAVGDAASAEAQGGDGAAATAPAGTDAAVAPTSPDGATPVAGPAPDFGPNVLVFDPSMPMSSIQSRIDAVYSAQSSAQFGTHRYAYFFKPGQYTLDVQLGFYMQAIGLGSSPDDVTITGAVRSKATWNGGNATLNFWRAAENLAVVPTQDSNVDVWAVSQGTDLRRVHVKGAINLSDGGWSSGGFIADSVIDAKITSGSQQQFLTRNTTLTNWQGGVWNMVFVGDEQPPSGSWPGSPVTVVATTPTVREKPYLVVDSAGAYSVVVPGLRTDSQGPSWSKGNSPASSVLAIDRFFVAHAGSDTAETMNAALASGMHLILTPGIYHLDQSLKLDRPGVVVLGFGEPTLVPDAGSSAIDVADVDAVTIAGLLLEAGPVSSPSLLTVGPPASANAHAQNPTALFDVHCRVGGADVGTAASCVTVNSNDVLLDDVWLWRADHGAGASWTGNPSLNGLVVNGSGVSAYGLFVEHFQQYQTLWNGNGGRTYFYQSEMPYDPPSQSAWSHGGVNGYASYKVADAVTSHDARGLGVYCVFHNAVVADDAIESPTASGVTLQHMVTEWLGTAQGSAINHIVNGTGAAVNSANKQAK